METILLTILLLSPLVPMLVILAFLAWGAWQDRGAYWVTRCVNMRTGEVEFRGPKIRRPNRRT